MLVAMAHSLADSDLRMIQEKIPLGGVAAREIFWGQTPIEIGSAGRPPAEFAHHAPNKHQPGAMSLSADALYKMSDVELLAAYVEARRQFVEKKFTRDTHRARLEWIKAKMFTGSSGGVTERNMAIDVSEEIARKGQELREMTRDLDLLKIDADIIAIVIRSRNTSAPTGVQGEDASDGEREGH
jgi:hypothetical protein